MIDRRHKAAGDHLGPFRGRRLPARQSSPAQSCHAADRLEFVRLPEAAFPSLADLHADAAIFNLRQKCGASSCFHKQDCTARLHEDVADRSADNALCPGRSLESPGVKVYPVSESGWSAREAGKATRLPPDNLGKTPSITRSASLPAAEKAPVFRAGTADTLPPPRAPIIPESPERRGVFPETAARSPQNLCLQLSARRRSS